MRPLRPSSARRGRRRLRVLAALAVLGAAAGQAKAQVPPVYYLSLGDSLAAGVQPDSRGRDRPTNAGYVDYVASRLRPRYGNLGVVKLGGGGTTGSLISGRAPNPAHGPGSQLDQARRFLAQHPGQVALVTIDIGDNDVERCIGPGGIDYGCVNRGVAAVDANIGRIVSALRSAGGADLRIVGVSDYDQFWALWLNGGSGRTVARRSATVIGRLNRTLGAAYTRAGALVADAGPAFATQALHPRVRMGRRSVPLAVARVCAWTWACDGPTGFDDHAKASGYRVIGRTVMATLARAESQAESGGVAAP